MNGKFKTLVKLAVVATLYLWLGGCNTIHGIVMDVDGATEGMAARAHQTYHQSKSPNEDNQ